MNKIPPYLLFSALGLLALVGCSGSSNAEKEAEEAMQAHIRGLNNMAEIYETGGTEEEIETKSNLVSKEIKAAAAKLDALGKDLTSEEKKRVRSKYKAEHDAAFKRNGKAQSDYHKKMRKN